MLQSESGAHSFSVVRCDVKLWTHHKQGRRVNRAVTAGETAVFGPRDAIYYDADTAHAAVNPGDVSVAVLAVTVFDMAQPQTIPVRT